MVLWLERMNEIRQPGYYVKTFKTFIKVYSAFCAICTSTSRKNLQNLLQGPLIITFWSIVSCWLISEMSLVLLLLPYCRAIFSWVSKVRLKYNATGLKNLATSSSSQAKTNNLLPIFYLEFSTAECDVDLCYDFSSWLLWFWFLWHLVEMCTIMR